MDVWQVIYGGGKIMTTIKDLNLGMEKIQEITTSLKWTINELLECDDFHVEDSIEDMLNWIYEGATPNILFNMMGDMKVINPNISLLDNLLLNMENVFIIDDGYLFFYV